MDSITFSAFADEFMKIAEDPKVEAAIAQEVSTVEDLQAQLQPGDVLFTAPHR